MMIEVPENMADPVGAYCDWYSLFDKYEKVGFAHGLRSMEKAVTMVSVLFCTYGYLKGGLLVRNPQSAKSHANLEFYFLTIYVRSIVMTCSHMDYFQNMVEIWFDPCKFLAFLETFTAVLEIESLTHVCVERYAVARYITNGWPIPRDHYTNYIFLTLMFSFGYAFFYESDFSGCTCTYDLALPDTWKRRFILAIFLFRSVKPTVLMVMMLYWANWMEKRFTSAMMTRADLYFTKTVTTLTFVNLICWAPFAVMKGWVLFTKFCYINVGLNLPTSYIRLAICLHLAAPIAVMLTVVITDAIGRGRVTETRRHGHHNHQE